MINFNTIFHVVESVYRFIQIWNSSQLAIEFRSSQVEISAPFQNSCCPRSPCGCFYCHFGLHQARKRAVLLAESRNCLPSENIAGSFSETRLVSRDIRFLWPIKSSTAFLFDCLNLSCLDRSSAFMPNLLHHHWIIVHLLQILFCGTRSGNVIDGIEVGI